MKISRNATVLAVLLAAMPGTLNGQEVSAGETLSLDHYLDWERASSPTLSPDSSQIIFTRSWVDKINDKWQSALWIMNADGSRPRFLTKGSSARWSPDGERIAYIASGDPEGAQIHAMWIDTREATQITRLTEGPSNLRWSPNGEQISFSMTVLTKMGFPIKLPKKPKGAKWAEEPTVITRLSYRRDRSGYRPKGYRHIFTVDANGGTPRQITSGDFDHRAGEWTPDGKSLVFSGLRVEDADWQVRESEIYSVDVASGEISQLTTRKGPDSGPVVSPDGKFIAYGGYDKNTDTYNIAEIHVMGIDGSNARIIGGGLDRSFRGLKWAADSKAVYFTVSSAGTRNLYRADLAGNITQITKGQQQFSMTEISAAGKAIGTLRSAHQPGDIAILDLSNPSDIDRLTHVNEDLLSHVTLGAQEEIWYDSLGMRVQGWIIKPPDFDPNKKYPLILQIHGGPHGMYGVDFNFERQNHAANGYVVLYTNPRGSVGYGKEFGNAINNAYPSKDYDDLMNGVDAVIARGYIDEEKLFVYGGSGGGVLTAWIVGHTDRFAGAVSMFPVINWISFVGTTDGPSWYNNFKKRPWEDITEHWNRSPLKYVGNVTTPTMLITGELDLRTPMAQTEEFYQALKLRKVETVMVRIPDEYHGAAGKHFSNTLRRILYVRGWFEKSVEDDKAAVEASAEKAGR